MELMRPTWTVSEWVSSGEVVVQTPSGSDVSSEDDGPTGKFILHSVYAYVTWSQSRIDDHEEFFCKLRAKMPEGTKIFGGRELHQDGHSHYHVVMQFPRRIHWTDARKHFMLQKEDGEVDTEAIRIEVPRLYEPVVEYLDRTQSYCEKDDNPWLFGERIEALSTKAALRKRVYQEIIDEPDPVRAEQMLIRHDPYEYVKNFGSIDRYLQSKRERRGGRGRKKVRRFDPSSWRVPVELLEWKRMNIDEPGNGRKKALVLIGDPGFGKTKWAQSFGVPIEMSTRWNLSQYREDATHVVVNDVDALKFGSGGDSYWREVFGCQEEFSVTDRYRPTVSLEWDFPCVWTCNKDLDPRQYVDVADYLQKVGAVVVELTEPLFHVDSLCVRTGGGAQRQGAEPPLTSPKRRRLSESEREPLVECLGTQSTYHTQYVDLQVTAQQLQPLL